MASIAITGASGLIGQALSEFLERDGHTVHRFVRRPPRNSSERFWDPNNSILAPSDLADIDAIVNLSGAGIAEHRWSDSYKREILSSRTRATSLLAATMAAMSDGPKVLVQGSAIGAYGDRGDEFLTEDSERGQGFLADVVRAWEGAASSAVDAGARVVYARTGIVWSRRGGTLGNLMPILKLGIGGPLSSGEQWWSWITLEDEVRALAFLATDSTLSGPVNLTSPDPQRQGDATHALARAVRRPSFIKVPQFALRVALGEFAGDVVASQRVLPSRLNDAGFRWRQANLQSAVAYVTAENDPVDMPPGWPFAGAHD